MKSKSWRGRRNEESSPTRLKFTDPRNKGGRKSPRPPAREPALTEGQAGRAPASGVGGMRKVGSARLLLRRPGGGAEVAHLDLAGHRVALDLALVGHGHVAPRGRPGDGPLDVLALDRTRPGHFVAARAGHFDLERLAGLLEDDRGSPLAAGSLGRQVPGPADVDFLGRKGKKRADQSEYHSRDQKSFEHVTLLVTIH